MKEHPLIIAALQPLNSPTDVGEPSDDFPVFDDLDTEMMKRGTLSHNEIDWSWIDEQLENLLSKSSKDIRLIDIACMSMMRKSDFEGWVSALCLLTEFLKNYSGECHPTNKKRKSGTINKCMAYFLKPLPVSEGTDLSLWKIASQNFADLLADYEKLGLTSASKIKTQKERIDQTIQEFQGSHESETPKSTDKKSDKVTQSKVSSQKSSPAAQAQPVQSKGPPPPSVHSISEADERQFRKSIYLISDHILTTDPENPLSYQLRRYALWKHVTDIPPIKSDTITVLTPVGGQIVGEIATALQQEEVNYPELILKLERVLGNAPFWLEGHLEQVKLLSLAGYTEAVEAVLLSLEGFLQKLPQLSELSFSNGEKFISSELPKKATAVETTVEDNVAKNILSSNSLTDSSKIEHDGNLESVDQAIGMANTTREKYLQLINFTDILRSQGLSHASQLFNQQIDQTISSMTIKEWESKAISQSLKS